VRELDLSESEFTFARFDFRRYLPHLETLKAEDIPQFNCSSEKLWYVHHEARLVIYKLTEG
jgi:hypothetical protein